MSLQETKNSVKRELDLVGQEASALKEKLKSGLSEAKDSIQIGAERVKAAMKQAGIEAETLRTRTNEEIKKAKQSADEPLGGRTLGDG